MRLSRLHDDIVQKFSQVRINVPSDLKSVLSKWSVNNIQESSLSYATREYPRVFDYHVTVKYGLYTNDPSDVSRIISLSSPFKIKLGDLSTFDYDDYQILKIDVRGSAHLHTLHKQLLKKLRNEETHVEYRPHITLAYMKYGEADKFIGNDIFYDYTFTTNKVVFVDVNKNRVELPLAINY